MKSIECINFVSTNSPNILLIADKSNNVPSGICLKHFKNSHNIYAIFHKLDDNFTFYENLPSQHSFIEEELNKNNLYKFSIFPISFGSFLAYYLIFHFQDRVLSAILHDYHWLSHCVSENLYFYQPNISTNNWKIPKQSNIPIIFSLHKSEFTPLIKINEILNIFPNIFIIYYPNYHHLCYKFDKLFHNIGFILLNKFSINSFWNVYFPNFINFSKIPKNKNFNITQKIFFWIFKKYKNRY